MKKLTQVAGVAALGLSLQANAALILDTGVTASFTGGSTGLGDLRFGQLYADNSGIVEFFYAGSEAGYTNSLQLGAASFAATPGFLPPDTPLDSISVGAGQFLGFGFCTSGGASIGSYGRCAYNNDADSLIAQFNHAVGNGEPGYRSIAFRALDSYDPLTGLSNAPASSYAAPGTTSSSLWALFWDDSGAGNDDDYNDYIGVARYTPTVPNQTGVPEPLTLTLLGSGLLAMGFLRRRVRS